MRREVTIFIRLLNLCEMHKTDPLTVVGLLAVNALAALDFEMLSFWSRLADNLRELNFSRL